MEKDLSIIIPAYNEEERIISTLERILSYIKSRDFSVEVIVVDDGSTDRTVDVVEENFRTKVKVVENGSNIGKGYSIKNGFNNSVGSIILFSDADLSTPIEEFDKMLKKLDDGYDVVIGSRALRESNIEKAQPWYRQLMGKTFNKIIKILVIGDFRDTQCGFKSFKREVAEKVFFLQRINGFAFDVELLFLAKKYGYRVFEMPVKWVNSPDSRVSIISGSVSMFVDVIKIRLYNICGKYEA